MFIMALDDADRPIIVPISYISKIEVATITGFEDGVYVHLESQEVTGCFLQVHINDMFKALDIYSEAGYAIDFVSTGADKPKAKPSVSSVVKMLKKVPDESTSSKDISKPDPV